MTSSGSILPWSALAWSLLGWFLSLGFPKSMSPDPYTDSTIYLRSCASSSFCSANKTLSLCICLLSVRVFFKSLRSLCFRASLNSSANSTSLIDYSTATRSSLRRFSSSQSCSVLTIGSRPGIAATFSWYHIGISESPCSNLCMFLS